LTWMLLTCGLSALWAFYDPHLPEFDDRFKGVFYNTRCLFQHADPYKTGAPLRAYLADEVGRPMPQTGPGKFND